MELPLTYWRSELDGPWRNETLEQHFRGLDSEITPEFQEQTLKLSIAVVDGPEDLEEWVNLYLEWDSQEEFDKWVSTLRDDLTRMLPNKENAPN